MLIHKSYNYKRGAFQLFPEMRYRAITTNKEADKNGTIVLIDKDHIKIKFLDKQILQKAEKNSEKLFPVNK